MATIITIGCSFVQGVGMWYEDVEPITSENRERHQQTYREEHLNVQLNNSIGAELQKELGYKTFINFGISGTSISNQLRIWFENPPKVNGDVLVLLFGTYPTRMGQYLNGSIGDVDLLDSFWSYPFKGEEKEDRTIEQIDFDLHLDFIHNLRVFKDYCEIRNWKFEYCLMNDDYPNIYHKEVGNSFPNPFKEFQTELNEDEKCHLSPHPNSVGYKKIYNKFIKWVLDNKREWYVGETPVDKLIGWNVTKFTIHGDRILRDKNRF